VQRVAATAWSPVSDRRIYVVWIGVAWAAILAGFGLDFARYRGETPPPFILHVHAAVYVFWLGLVTLQILWVEIGNLRRHKQLGWLTVAVSVLMVPLGPAAAVVDQVRQAAHKRLMLLSAVAISDAGFARFWLIAIKIEIPGLFGWWLQYLWGIFLILVAMGGWDLWRRRLIHPAVLFGAALLWAGEIITTLLNFSPTWRDLMVRLVNAWGHAG
jgi:hypothetical protein